MKYAILSWKCMEKMTCALQFRWDSKPSSTELFFLFSWEEREKHYIAHGIILGFSWFVPGLQIKHKNHFSKSWRWRTDLLNDAWFFIAKFSRSILKMVIKWRYSGPKNIFHEISSKLLVPHKIYFMLKASLHSDNIGLFYDILSIDVPIACK